MQSNILFYIFSSILVVSSIQIITVFNPVYSILFLIFSFLSASMMLFLLECEFLALLFIIVYVGAIAVLFLFIIMMLDIKTTTAHKDNVKYFPFGIFLGITFLIEVLILIREDQFLNPNPYHKGIFLEHLNYYNNWYQKIDSLTEIEVIGQILYTHYVVEFLVAGLILFLAVIGAVVLTIDFSEKKSFVQNDTKQIARVSNL